MAWALQDCDKVLKLGESRKEFGRALNEKLQAEEQLRKEVEEWAETQGAELEGARAELRSVQAEFAEIKEASSKYREGALMEISQLQARADDSERKLAGVPGVIAAAKTGALAEYQSSVGFQQVQGESFDDGVRTFIYNVWRKHPE